jgi:hypothetical protein
VNRSIRIAHLVVGLLFLGIAMIWLLRTTGLISAGQIALSGPVVLIAAGVVGLVVSLGASRPGKPSRPDHTSRYPSDYPSDYPTNDEETTHE